MSDEELVNNVKDRDCSESLKIICERHSPLFNKIYTKYSGPLKGVGMSRQDAFDEKQVLFYQAIKSFNHNREVKFTTYFANFARWYFLNTINHTEKLPLVDDLSIFDHIQLEIRRDSSPFYLQLPSLIKQFKDKRIEKIYELRYLQPGRSKKWKEIATEMGLSMQTCSKLHKRGIDQLKTVIDKVEVFS